MMRTREGLDTGTQLSYRGLEFEYLHRALGPIVFPAHDKVTVAGSMAVVTEIGAFELELYSHPFVEITFRPSLRVAIRKLGCDAFNEKTKFSG
ncbi:MAG: hypothetical protein ACRD1T_24045, partial [Acidimicrobiia bacterium]